MNCDLWRSLAAHILAKHLPPSYVTYTYCLIFCTAVSGKRLCILNVELHIRKHLTHIYVRAKLRGMRSTVCFVSL